MCDYCERYESLPNLYGKDNFKGHINLDVNYNKPVFSILDINDFNYDEGECPISFAVAIKYCPFCGRNLEGINERK